MNKLFYRENGSGSPIILLHGNGEDGSRFENQIEHFGRYMHVYAVDTPGHGRSDVGEGKFSLYRFADDLRDFMVGKGIGKAVILGFSDGGNVALIFALKYPEMVDKLILNGANLRPSGLKLSVQFPIYIGYGITSVISVFDKKAGKNRDILGLMAKEPRISPEELGRIKSPTLVIAGTNDMIKEKHTRLIAGSIEDASLVFVEGNHFIAYEKPEKFNAAVDAFLGAGK